MTGLAMNCESYISRFFFSKMEMHFDPSFFLNFSGDFFYRKSTIGKTKTATEANNGTYCLRKRIEKFPLAS